MKIALILTNDWELFGDGSGDFYDIQVAPLNEFLEYSRTENVPITLMAEVMQQFAFMKQKSTYYSDIAKKWEEMVLTTIDSGSDIQLHIHSQWHGAQFIDDKFLLNMDNWSIANLDEYTINDLISKGKLYLETLIRQSKKDYSCIAFRAGAYCIEPSSKVIPALKNNNFLADSSVTKHLKSTNYFDYSDAYSNYIPWNISSKSVKFKDDDSQLIEFPIFSNYQYDSQVIKRFFPKSYYKLFFNSHFSKDDIKWFEEKNLIKEKRYPASNRFYKKDINKNFNWYLKAIFSKNSIQLDYDYLPPEAFVFMINKIFKKIRNIENDLFLPIIASGHFKDIHNCNNIKLIIEKLRNSFKNDIEFWTLSKAIVYWQEKKQQILNGIKYEL